MTATHDPNSPPLPRSYRWIELGSVVICLSLLAALAVRTGIGIAASEPTMALVARVAAAALLGYWAADFASGVVHFVADTFGSVETPVLGRKFILPFRAHHDRPQEMTEHDFVETNGDSCFIALFVLVPVFVFVPAADGSGAALTGVFVVTLILFVVLTNQLHKWAHAKEAPRLVRALQRAGLVLRPAHHAQHHLPPYTGRYCITSGNLNPLLDAISFFGWLERALRWILRLFERTERGPT